MYLCVYNVYIYDVTQRVDEILFCIRDVAFPLV